MTNINLSLLISSNRMTGVAGKAGLTSLDCFRLRKGPSRKASQHINLLHGGTSDPQMSLKKKRNSVYVTVCQKFDKLFLKVRQNIIFKEPAGSIEDASWKENLLKNTLWNYTIWCKICEYGDLISQMTCGRSVVVIRDEALSERLQTM